MDSLSNSLNPNKLLKEQFVSNLSGSSMLEIAALSTIVPLLFLLRHSFPSNCKSGTTTKKNDRAVFASKYLEAYLHTITLDFLSVILPSLISLTVLADWTYLLAAILMALIFLIIAAKSYSSSSISSGGTTISLRDNISSYRINVMVMTCVCILAVDFTIFPRRYAKTETYGTSLMDIGVGSFVLVNALVSRQARGLSSMDWRVTIRSTTPLLLLGFARLLSTRSVDYQVHASEYGVHWNFFFTLAAVAVLTSIFNIPPQYSGVLGLGILIGYQCWLICGLNVYLLSDNRGADLISKNKEGIFSILGYWGMYLVGVQLGYHLFFGNSFSTTLRTKKWAGMRVLFLSVMFWLVTVLLDRQVERVSRRMCNLAYVTLVLAQNFQVLGLLMLSDFIPGSKISALEEAFNRNLLGSFLLANLLTGLVNLCWDTLFTPSHIAMVILTGYSYALSIIIGIAHFYGIRSKFW